VNIPKKFEGALLYVLKQCAKNKLPRIRTWQNISADAGWTPTNDRVFPVIDIRCASPVTNEDDGVTQLSNIALLVATNVNDDADHKANSAYYEEVQTILDSLYSQFRKKTPGAERNKFDEYLLSVVVKDEPVISIGGFEHGASTMPYEESGAYFTGLNWIIHFSRSDY